MPVKTRKTRWKTRFGNMVKREATRHVRQYLAVGTFPKVECDAALSDAEWADYRGRVVHERERILSEFRSARAAGLRVEFTFA